MGAEEETVLFFMVYGGFFLFVCFLLFLFVCLLVCLFLRTLREKNTYKFVDMIKLVVQFTHCYIGMAEC